MRCSCTVLYGVVQSSRFTAPVTSPIYSEYKMPPKPNSDLEEIKRMVVELNTKIDGIVIETKDIHAKLVAVSMEQTKLLERMEEENKQLRTEIKMLSSRCDRLEDEQRRKNLIISGIPISADHNEIVNFKNHADKIGLAKELVEALGIEQVVRMKRKTSGQPGDVIVKFRNISDKLCILKAARKTKPKDYIC